MEAREVVAVLLVVLCMCDLPIQARTRSTEFPLTSEGMPTAADDDDKPRLPHPDVSNLLKYPSCADFLLNGETQMSEVVDGGTLGWLNGEWFPPQEPSDLAAQSWVPHLHGDTVYDFHQIADFEVSQSSDKWEGWRPPSTPKSSLHTIGGVLTLSSMYSFPNGQGAPTRSSLPPGFGKHVLQVIYLQGASIGTETDHRLCMLGSAATPFPFQNQAQESSQEDFNFMVKMRYPKHHTIMSRQIEAEVTILTSVEDPMHSPRFSILGPSPDAKMIEFHPEIPDLLAADKMVIQAIDDGIAPKSVALASPEQLKAYLESPGQGRWVTGVYLASPKQNLTLSQGKLLQGGPFHLAQFQPPKDDGVVGVGVHMNFQDVRCRPNTLVGSKSMLVSALMHILVVVEQISPPFQGPSFINVQQMFSMEGEWNPVSGELCMVGCGEMLSRTISNTTYVSKFLGAGCNWKVCLQPVLRNYVDIDSPRGALLSSLRDPGHPDYFVPLKMTQTTFSFNTDDSTYPTEYRYTRISQAMELADTNRAAEGALVKFIDDHGLVFPTTKEGSDLCSHIMYLTMDLRLAQYVSQQGDFRTTCMMVVLDVTNIESCTQPFGYMGDRSRSPKAYPVGAYLNVAARFRIANPWPINGFWVLKEELLYGRGYPAEGVYEPHTGLMHLVVNYPLVVEEGDFVLHRLGDVNHTIVGALDREIHVKIQYPPSNPMSFEQRRLQVQVESLRKPSDSLYFPPLKLKCGYGTYYASETWDVPGVDFNRDMEGVLVETIILVSVMRQITHNRRNNDNSAPYVSIAMLGLQAIFRLGRSLTFTSTLDMFQLYYSWTQFGELGLVVKALTLVESLLLGVLIYRVLVARAARLKIDRTSGYRKQMMQPASERRTLALSTVAFGVAFVVVVSSEWLAYELWELKQSPLWDDELIWLLKLLPFSRWWIVRGLTRFLHLVQQLYLVPQVIANVLCDLKEAKPLSPVFILGPSLGYMISYLVDIYTNFHVAPELVAESISRYSDDFTSIGIADILPPIAKLGAVTCIFILAVIVHIQQKHGGRLGFFPSLSTGTPVDCEADDLIIKGAVNVQHEHEALDHKLPYNQYQYPVF